MLWGIPPSFCSLVQRAGRAGRDFTILSEAILISTAASFKKGISEAEVEFAVDMAVEEEEAKNCNESQAEMTMGASGIIMDQGHELVSVEKGGVRISQDSEEGDTVSGTTKNVWQKCATKEFNSQEARYLSLYISGHKC